MFVCFLSLCLWAIATGQTRPLEQYNVDNTTMSISGFSSGGAFAFQYHVAHSASMIGAGIYAGAPYACAVTHTTGNCAGNAAAINLQQLWDTTANYAAGQLIDDPINMANDRLYIFMGTGDTIVDPAVAALGRDYYREYVPLANIQTFDTMGAQHAYPHQVNGGPCHILDIGGGVYVNDCDYDGAYESLNHIYGDLQRPDWFGTDPPAVTGDYYEFDQTEFHNNSPDDEAWDPIGYMYVPSQCVNKLLQCRLHVHFHGCGMGTYWIDDRYVVDNGVREVAELNNIIVIYPQVKPSNGNSDGCWDWWGYSGADFAQKSASQMLATTRMINRVVTGA